MITLNTGAKLANNADGIIADAVDISGGYFVTESIAVTSTGEAGKIPDYACITGALCYCTADSKFYQYSGTDSGWVEKEFSTEASQTTAGLMSAADKEKLDGIDTGANKYEHPSTHAASMITGLAAVATSGSYNDLIDKPTISYNDLIDKPTITDTNVTLESDLYAYTNVGKITGATTTSPKKVASAGESLKTVFNNVFGTATDATPDISNNSSLTATGGDSYSGGEYGTAISAKTVTATFTLANTGTAQYGYKCGDTTYTTSNKTFYYPITLQSDAQIKFTLPKTIEKAEDVTENNVEYKKITHTADSDSTTVTVLVQKNLYKSYSNDTSNSTLYCDLSSNSISLIINLPAKTATTSQQTRYGTIDASVQLGSPQDDEGNSITKFLTYFEQQGKEAVATAPSVTAAGEKTDSTSAYTIAAGNYYNYYLASTSTSLSNDTSAPVTTATRFSSSTISISCTDASHIWFLLPPDTSGSKSIQYEPFANTWVDAFGGAADTTVGPVDVALKLDSSPTTGDPVVVTYKGYYTSAKAAAGSELNYKII